MLDSDLLANFLNIVDHGGFTAAARAAHSTQSTVSAKLARLEDQVGHRLMQRNRRGVIALTREGREIEALARETTRLHTLARRRLDEAPVQGSVRLGMSDDIASAGNYPTLLAAFCRSQPGIRLEVTVGAGPQLQHRLERGEIDHLLCKAGDDSPAGAVELWREALVWIGQPEACDRRASALPLVTFTPPCRYRQRAIRVLEGAGIRWRAIYVSPSLAGVRAAVEAGLGVSLLPRSLAGDRRLHGPDRTLPDPGSIAFVAISRTEATDPANRVFRTMLESLLPPHTA